MDNNYTNNQQMNWNQQPYNQQPYGQQPYGQQPVQPEPKKGKGFGIAALVIGILSMTLCCTIGAVIGIVGIVLGIVSLVKKEDMPGLGIAGIITSVIGFFVGIYVLFCIIVAYQIVEEEMEQGLSIDEIYEELESDSDFGYDDGLDTDKSDEFEGTGFYIGESGIYFGEDDTFTWYESDADHSDNFFVGTYELRFAEDALDYLVYDISEYGITKEELDQFHEANSDNDFYSMDNLCVLTLHNKGAIVDGESVIDEAYDTHYYGYYSDGYFDACNMGAGEYVPFEMMQ